MLVVVIKEGLGNQLFQYATGRCLAHKLGVELKLDICHYEINRSRKYSLKYFEIAERFITPKEKIGLRARNFYNKGINRLGIKVRPVWYFESDFEFNRELFLVADNTVIDGYWQSEEYFIDIKNIIKKEFKVKVLPTGKNAEFLRDIERQNSIAIHVRRGDYVNNEYVNSIHGVCGIQYFEDAIKYINERIDSPCFFVFSDDMDWARENINIKNCRINYVEHNKDDEVEDFRLMYSCKHQIISNSSFSWWAAWLNSNENKIVVAPNNWFKSTRSNKDILPKSWIRL